MVFGGTKRQCASGEVSWQPPALETSTSCWQRGPVSGDGNRLPPAQTLNGTACEETVVSEVWGAQGNLAAAHETKNSNP